MLNSLLISSLIIIYAIKHHRLSTMAAFHRNICYILLSDSLGSIWEIIKLILAFRVSLTSWGSSLF